MARVGRADRVADRRLSWRSPGGRSRAEKASPKTDVWFVGTGDPHLQAAESELTVEERSPQLAQLRAWVQQQAQQSVYKGEIQVASSVVSPDVETAHAVGDVLSLRLAGHGLSVMTAA